jgi:hypothetical protein
MSTNNSKIGFAVLAIAALLRASVIHAEGVPRQLEELKQQVASFKQLFQRYKASWLRSKRITRLSLDLLLSSIPIRKTV